MTNASHPTTLTNQFSVRNPDIGIKVGVVHCVNEGLLLPVFKCMSICVCLRVDKYLAISSLWAVQSRMYSSCSRILCLRTTPPGPRAGPRAELGAEPDTELGVAPGKRGLRRIWEGLRWGRPCLDKFLFEPNSSSEVEPYSGGNRRHLLDAGRRRGGKEGRDFFNPS